MYSSIVTHTHTLHENLVRSHYLWCFRLVTIPRNVILILARYIYIYISNMYCFNLPKNDLNILNPNYQLRPWWKVRKFFHLKMIHSQSCEPPMAAMKNPVVPRHEAYPGHLWILIDGGYDKSYPRRHFLLPWVWKDYANNNCIANAWFRISMICILYIFNMYIYFFDIS